MISIITIALSEDMHNGGALIFLTKFIMAFLIMLHVWNRFRCLILTQPDPNPNWPRHLTRDLGYGFQIAELYKSGYLVIWLATTATTATITITTTAVV
jgi:hypothetical protein